MGAGLGESIDIKSLSAVVRVRLRLIAEMITLFYKQVELKKGLPFDIAIPNKVTRRTLEKLVSDAETNIYAAVRTGAVLFISRPLTGGSMKILLLAVFAVVLAVAPAVAAEGVIDVQSSFTVAETANRLEHVLQEKGMTIFDRVEHSQAAGKIGIEMRDTVLIIFGNPKVGSPLMKCRQSVAIDLPQKALIWQDEKGIVWVSYNDPRYLERRHEITGCEEVIAKIENALADIVKAAASK